MSVIVAVGGTHVPEHGVLQETGVTNHQIDTVENVPRKSHLSSERKTIPLVIPLVGCIAG